MKQNQSKAMIINRRTEGIACKYAIPTIHPRRPPQCSTA